MKKLLKTVISLVLVFISVACVACKNKTTAFSEEITLASTVLDEVEFESSKETKIKQADDGWIVTGRIEAMSEAQKSAFGVQGVTHVVVVKFEFDKKRTIDYFKIDGQTTKVYSTDKNEEGYVGSISSLLDSKSEEDAFCYLILSANTKTYELTAKYTDSVESKIKLNIDATLVTASSEN